MHVNERSGQLRRSQRSRASDQNHSLFEPFGYAASVTRVSGERFRGGILSGLEIVGLPQDHHTAEAADNAGSRAQENDGVVLHIGSRQVSVLAAIGLLLVPAASQERAPSSDTDEAAEGQNSSSATEPTVFSLPFPSLNLVLPESEQGRVPTTISLPGCTLKYRTDGEIFVITGQEGINDNGHPLVDLGMGGEWSIDVAHRHFALRTAHDQDGGSCSSTVTLGHDGLRRTLSSIDQVLASADVTHLQSAWEGTAHAVPVSQTQDQPLESWSVSMDPTTIRLANSASEWIEARVQRFHAEVLRGAGGCSLSSGEVGGIVVRSGFAKDAHLTVSPVKLSNGTLHIPSVDGVFASHDEIQALQRFLLSFGDFGRSRSQAEPLAAVQRDVFALPIPVNLDLVRITVKDADSDLRLSNIWGKETTFECDNMTCVQGEWEVEVQQSKIDFAYTPTSSTAVFADVAFARAALSVYDTPKREQLRGVASTTAVTVQVSVSGHVLAAELSRKAELHLEDRAGDWLAGFIETSKVKVNIEHTIDPVSFDSVGAGIVASSFGAMQVHIPSLQLAPGNNSPVLNVGILPEDTIKIYAGSMGIIQQMQCLLSAMQMSEHKEDIAEESKNFPFPIKIHAIRFSLGAKSDQCSSSSTDVPNARCTLKGVSVNIGSAIEVTVQNIEEAGAPRMFDLIEPIQNTTILYSRESLNIQTNSAKVQILKPVIGGNRNAKREVSTIGDDLHIPFTIHVDVARLYLYCLPEEGVKAQVVGTKICVSPTHDGILNINSEKKIRLRIVHANQSIDLRLQASSVALSKSLAEVKTMHFGGGRIDSCSLGVFNATLPPCTMLPDTNTIIVDASAAVVNLDSVNLALKVQRWATNALQWDPSGPPSPLAVGLCMPNLKVSIKDLSMRFAVAGISANLFVISCNALNIQDESGTSMSVLGLDINFKAGYHVRMKTVHSLVIPGVMMLSAPVENSSLWYSKDNLKIAIESIEGIVQPRNQNTASKSNSFNLPAPVDIKVKSITIREKSRLCMASISNIGILANQSKSTIWLRAREGMKLKLHTSPNEWICATVGSLSTTLQQEKGGIMSPQKVQFSGGSLGPCSLGQLSVVLPSVYQEMKGPILFKETITASVDSIQVVEKLSTLLGSIAKGFSSEGHSNTSATTGNLPYPVEAPGIAISVLKPAIDVQIGQLSAMGSTIDISSIKAIADGSISTSFIGLRASIQTRQLIIRRIESLLIPNTIALSKPILNLTLKYDHGFLSINSSMPIHARIISTDAPVVASNSSQNKDGIPCPMKIELGEVHVAMPYGKNEHVSLHQVNVHAMPEVLPGQDLLDSDVKKDILISLQVGSIEHPLFQAKSINTAAVLRLGDTDILHKLNASLESACLTAGFSSLDWSSLMGRKEGEEQSPRKVISTPCANVSNFNLSISYQGALVSSATTIAVPAFVGDTFTTSNDLVGHYSNVVLNRMPGFVTNAEILGGNVVDGTMKGIGKLMLKGTTSMSGAVGGSVIGTAAADGLRSAVSAGKQFRNVEANEAYQFGDISRGILRGVSEASKVGASSRGGDGSDYVPGDLTIGAVQATSEYVGNNFGKLASAGASGVGSMVGFAVAGPLGFVAGSYLGGSAVGPRNDNEQSVSVDASKMATQYQQNSPNLNSSQPPEAKRQAYPCQQSHTAYVAQQTNKDQRPPEDSQAPRPHNQQHTHGLVNRHQQQFQNQYTSGLTNQSGPAHNQPSHYQHQTQTSSTWYHGGQVNPRPQQFQNQSAIQSQQARTTTNQGRGYQFGDLTRGVVQKGKQADGRSKQDGYKFGEDPPSLNGQHSLCFLVTFFSQFAFTLPPYN